MMYAWHIFEIIKVETFAFEFSSAREYRIFSFQDEKILKIIIY